MGLFHLAILFGALLPVGSNDATDDGALLPRRSSPDPVFFEDRVQPVLMSRCAFAGCHNGPGAGRLILERADFTGVMSHERTESNLATTLQFVSFGEPMKSRLILKPLKKRDGGIPHSGDEYDFRNTSEEFKTLADWISGVEVGAVPPISHPGEPRGAKVGEEVILDGTKSRDRRDRPLSYEWRIESMPEGSVPLLKGADTPHPRFRADTDGAYSISLVVDNGETKSEPSSVTIDLDSTPFQVLEAEHAIDPVGFYVAHDPAAAGGSALRVGQQASGTEATATFPFTLPEGGPYRLFAKVRVDADPTPLWFRFDDGPEMEFLPEPTVGYRLLPVADPARSGAEPTLKVASGKVWSGSASTRDGRLRVVGSPRRPAIFTFGEHAAIDELKLRMSIQRPDPDELVDTLALVLFRATDRDNADFAGIHLGRQRWVIGRMVDGVPKIETEHRFPMRPDVDYDFSVGIRDRTLFLFPPGADPIETKLKEPTEGTGVAIYTTGVASVDAFQINRGAEVVLRQTFDVEGHPDGHLASGQHQLHVRADSVHAPALDEFFLARSDLDDAVDDASRRLIRALYLDLVGRVPTGTELMMAAGLDRATLAKRLIGSLEFYENLYELELYYFLLLDNFRPKTPALNSIPARLMNGQVTLQDAVQEIVISQYFNARNPGNDTFVSVVLEQLLGMVVQDEPKILDAGKEMYDGRKTKLFGVEGDSQSDIVYITLADARFHPFLLQRHYERIFLAPPEAADLRRWGEMFRADPRAYEAIVVEWITSAAYDRALEQARPKSDHMWIRALFVDLLNRKPSFDEYRNFRNAVQALSDSGPLRSVLSKVIVDSGQVPLPLKNQVDSPIFVKDLYLRFLGRGPNGKELSTMLQVWQDPACTPAMVLLAIISSAEYQHY